MDRQTLNKDLAKYTSLPRYQVRRHLIEFSAIIGHSDVVLDLGSGMDKPYRQLFRSESYYGIDLYQPADIQGDISFLPFPNNLSDTIVCSEVLEHVPNPGEVLLEFHRVLKPGRYFVITVPLLWGEHETVDYQRWTEAGLRKLLTACGFDIVAFKRRGGLFSSIGCMIAQTPLQVFGGFQMARNIFTKLLFLVGVIIVLPIPWICSLFDGLDRNKKFVLGYSLLCCKKANGGEA